MLLNCDAKLIRVSDNHYRLSGTCELFAESYKSIIVDGETYYRTSREITKFDYDKMYDDGDMHDLELDLFADLFGTVKVSYPIEHDNVFSIIKNKEGIESQSSYVNMIHLLCEAMGLKEMGFHWYSGKNELIYNTTIDTIVKQNAFPYVLFSYGFNNTFVITIPYQYLVKNNFAKKLHVCKESIYRKYVKLFNDFATDEQKTQAMIYYSEVRADLLLREQEVRNAKRFIL